LLNKFERIEAPSSNEQLTKIQTVDTRAAGNLSVECSQKNVEKFHLCKIGSFKNDGLIHPSLQGNPPVYLTSMTNIYVWNLELHMWENQAILLLT